MVSKVEAQCQAGIILCIIHFMSFERTYKRQHTKLCVRVRFALCYIKSISTVQIGVQFVYYKATNTGKFYNSYVEGRVYC